MTQGPGAARGDRGTANPERPSPGARPSPEEEALAPGDGTPAAGVPEGPDPVAAVAGVGDEPAAGTILDDLAGLAAERDEYLGALQRLQADFENYRKRVLRQQEEQSARAAADLVGKVLPVLDTLDLARAHLGAGAEVSEEARALDQARAQLLDVLSKEGLERVDAAGVEFDPVVHDAVAHAPADPGPSAPDGGPDGQPAEGDIGDEAAAPVGVTVDAVLRAGYRWRGQVLRPAMVRVRG